MSFENECQQCNLVIKIPWFAIPLFWALARNRFSPKWTPNVQPYLPNNGKDIRSLVAHYNVYRAQRYYSASSDNACTAFAKHTPTAYSIICIAMTRDRHFPSPPFRTFG
jgi:hypothetical protein